jgi:hypothetical protein
MREFFKQELKTLYAKYQLNQFEKLCSMTDERGQSIGKEMVKALLDELEKVCRKFPYIPDEAKKELILDFMASDQDFIGLNAKMLYKWFDLKKAYYWAQATPEQREELTPEEIERRKPLPPEKAEVYVKQWMEAVELIGGPKTSPQPAVERFGFSRSILPDYIKEFRKGKTAFIIEGIEIWAETEEKAQEIFVENNL